MSRRSRLGRNRTELDLVWPLGGVDRRVSFQTQPPWTTPVAVNVRVDGTVSYRQRGGSRPGLRRAINTQLPGPIRLLTKVSELRSRTAADVATGFYGELVGLDAPSWNDNPSTTIVDSLGRISGIMGANVSLAFPSEITDRVDTTVTTEVSTYVSPCNEDVPYSGSVKISIASPFDADPTIAGFVAVLNLSNGSYHCVLTEYLADAVVQTTTTPIKTDFPEAPGLFTVRFTPSGSMTAWFRGVLLGALSVGTAKGPSSSVTVVSGNESICISQYHYNFSSLPSSNECFSSSRKDTLVAIADGKLYVEDSNTGLKHVSSAITFGDCQRYSADDREQKLYIADYGVAYSEEIEIASPYDTLTFSADVEAIGVTSAHRVEISKTNHGVNSIQQVEVTAAVDGGTFRLRYGTLWTGDIAYDASAADIKAALEAISTIDSVTVTGTTPTWTVTFGGTLAKTNVIPLYMDATKLTASVGVASGGVKIITVGYGDENIVGTYAIDSVSGTDVTLSSAIPASTTFTASVRIAVPPKIFDPQTETISVHTATAGKGFVPTGARCVAIYRDRVVYAGADDEPGVWWMSRQGDPDDWDITQEDSGAAIGASNAPAGKLGDPITALIPHGDLCLIFGCRSSLWICRGDPGYGGEVDQLSRKIGIIDQHAWTRTPDDMVVFLSTDGLYVIPAGCAGSPTSLSRERLPDELLGLSPENYAVTLEYDTEARGIHIFATRTDIESANKHWFMDWETKSFWEVLLKKDHEPISTFERNIFGTGFNQVLIGGRDGYIRVFDRLMETDDGETFDSYCYFGPMAMANPESEAILTEITGEIPESSGPIGWEVKCAQTAQQSVKTSPQATGVWSGEGLQYTARPRVRGGAMVIKLFNAVAGRRWVFERATAYLRQGGLRRKR